MSSPLASPAASQQSQIPSRPPRSCFPTFYCVYLLQSIPKPNSFYVGSTPTPVKRLRQHNGTIRTGGAYRTKPLKKRPWLMIACVGRFPSKIAALQFESALQHPYQSRHLANSRISSSNRSAASVHHRVGNIRLLVDSLYFSKMNLKVYIFNSAFHDKWLQNKYKAPDVAYTHISFDAFFNSTGTGSLHSLVNDEIDTSSSFSSSAICTLCRQSATKEDFAFACACGSYYHLVCLLKKTDDLLPKKATCVSCMSSWPWAHVARMATNAEAVEWGEILQSYQPDQQLSQLVDKQLDSP